MLQSDRHFWLRFSPLIFAGLSFQVTKFWICSELYLPWTTLTDTPCLQGFQMILLLLSLLSFSNLRLVFVTVPAWRKLVFYFLCSHDKSLPMSKFSHFWVLIGWLSSVSLMALKNQDGLDCQILDCQNIPAFSRVRLLMFLNVCNASHLEINWFCRLSSADYELWDLYGKGLQTAQFSRSFRQRWALFWLMSLAT